MKKLFVVLCVAAIGFAFTSCKKDCVCNWTGKDLPAEITKDIDAGKMSKKDCEAYTTTAPAGFTDLKLECKVK